MWHWRALIRARDSQRLSQKIADGFANMSSTYSLNNAKHYDNQARSHQKKADFHLGAVQALNDVVPGSAEDDCAEVDKIELGLVTISPAALKKLRKESEQ